MKWSSALLCLAALPSGAESFRLRQAATPARRTDRSLRPPLRTAPRGPSASSSTGLAMSPLLTHLRGGASVLAPVQAALASSGPVGVAALAALTASVVTPLALYRQAYSFSVGYAASVAAVGWALSRAFDLRAGGPAGILVGALVFYGIRLAGHLLLREVTVASKRESLRSMDATPRLRRIPFSLSVGLFYALLCVPALYLCRAEGALSEAGLAIARSFAGGAWFWAIVEAWADAQKLWAKRGKDGAEEFAGPAAWWYGVSRHPNYLGEVAFWLSVLGAGLPAIWANRANGLWTGTVLPAVCSGLGTLGIVQVMLGATKRLEEKQEERYGGQDSFDEWKAKTSALFPNKAVSFGNAILPCLVAAALSQAVATAAFGVPWPLLPGPRSE